MTAKTRGASAVESKPQKDSRHWQNFPQGYCRSKRPPGTVCCLCGECIAPGMLLVHKAERHGERIVTPTPEIRPRNTWVRVVQGGLPGLGRRH